MYTYIYVVCTDTGVHAYIDIYIYVCMKKLHTYIYIYMYECKYKPSNISQPEVGIHQGLATLREAGFSEKFTSSLLSVSVTRAFCIEPW